MLIVSCMCFLHRCSFYWIILAILSVAPKNSCRTVGGPNCGQNRLHETVTSSPAEGLVDPTIRAPQEPWTVAHFNLGLGLLGPLHSTYSKNIWLRAPQMHKKHGISWDSHVFFCLVLYGSQENPTAQWALSQHFRPVPMVQQPGAGPRRPNKQGVEMSWNGGWNSDSHRKYRVVPEFPEIFIWVCLKIGYIPNYSHLMGIMITNIH